MKSVLGTAKKRLHKETARKRQCTAQALCIKRRRPSVLYPITSCYCHTTQAAVAGPSHYDGAPFSPWERMFAYYFNIPPGPQENKPISCHCDRIKMEPSYFSNTMQAKGNERGRGTVRESAISPIQRMNYGPASFSRKDYKLILSPQDNYSKVQLLTQHYRVALHHGFWHTPLLHIYLFTPT